LAARLPLELSDTAAGRLAHLAVTVIRQPLQRTQGRRGGREPQRLDRRHPQLARFPPEKPPGRLRPLDERLYRVRAPDPAQCEDQLAHHRLVLFLFHRDHERHGQRARLTSATLRTTNHCECSSMWTSWSVPSVMCFKASNTARRSPTVGAAASTSISTSTPAAPPRCRAATAAARCLGAASSRERPSRTGLV